LCFNENANRSNSARPCRQRELPRPLAGSAAQRYPSGAGRRRHCNKKEPIMAKIEVQNHSSLGLLWCAGWLFTLGYLKLGFWRGLLGVIVWPYFIGADLAAE